MELIKEYIKVNICIDFIEKEMNIKLTPYQIKIIKNVYERKEENNIFYYEKAARQNGTTTLLIIKALIQMFMAKDNGNEIVFISRNNTSCKYMKHLFNKYLKLFNNDSIIILRDNKFNIILERDDGEKIYIRFMNNNMDNLRGIGQNNSYYIDDYIEYRDSHIINFLKMTMPKEVYVFQKT